MGNETTGAVWNHDYPVVQEHRLWLVDTVASATGRKAMFLREIVKRMIRRERCGGGRGMRDFVRSCTGTKEVWCNIQGSVPY
jgi:hypothetical protein